MPVTVKGLVWSMFSLFLRQFTCPLPLADSLHLSRLRAGLSHMEFSNRSSLRTHANAGTHNPWPRK